MTTENAIPNESYWLCPLYSFNCHSIEDLGYPPEKIDLLEDIQLQLVTPELRNYLQLRYPDWDEASVADYMIVMPRTYWLAQYGKASFLREIADKSELLVDLISAFRLYHTGGVTPGPLLPSKPSVFGDIATYISKTEIDSTSFWLPEYEFNLSDVPMFNKLMGEIRTCRKTGKLGAVDEALRRFNSSYSGEPEDRLIDQMIAFESLYIGDDKELGYKLALRTAFFLGKKRKQIFSDMKQAYDFRGKVVHGTKKMDLLEIEKIIPKTEEYLRQSIRKFLALLPLYSPDDLKKAKEKRLAKLDENILNNGRVLAFTE